MTMIQRCAALGAALLIFAGACSPKAPMRPKTAPNSSAPPKRAMPTKVEVDPAFDDVPFVFIGRYPGWRGGESGVKTSILAALWQDGTLVRAVDEESAGQAYVRAKLSATALADIKQAIEDSGILATELGGQVLPNGVTINLTLRSKDGLRRWEYSPRSGIHDAIKAVEDALMSVELTDPVTLPPDDYIGYPKGWLRVD